MTQKFKFSEGERVLCFHGPLIYEAKALKSTISKDKQIKYYIHYAGWNKNWDEWVPEDRVLKYNEANVQRQQEVFKEHSSSASNKSKKAATKGKKGDGPPTKDGGTSSGGSESRASTPSKEVNTLSAPSRSRSSKQAANTSLNSSSSAAKEANSSSGGGGNGATSNTNSKDTESKKEDTKDNITPIKEDKEETEKKKKRGSSVSSNERNSEKVSEKSSNTSTGTSTNANVSSSAASTPTPTATPTPTSERRLDESSNGNGNSTLESVGTFLSKQEVKIKIPDELKQCLADDWDAVTRQHKLIEVPAKITVQDIIDQYIAFKKSTKSTNSSKEVKIVDVMNGIVEYFNVMLGSQLLYKYERPRYAEVLQQFPDTPPSKLYGAFHLLRLFIKLGSMLGYSGMDANKLAVLVTSLQDFLKFLVKNSSTYFTMACFVNATPEYHRNTQ